MARRVGFEGKRSAEGGSSLAPGRAVTIVLLACSLLLSAAGIVAGQVPVPGGGESAGGDEAADVRPLLPEEGLLEAETWSALLSRLMANLVDYLPRFFAALLVLAVFWFLAGLASKVVDKAVARASSDRTLRDILKKLVRVSVLVIGVVMAASQAGIAVGSLIAGVGVAGLAIGLAAQDSMSNVVAGLTILWDKPFRAGDRVTIADEYGDVQEVGLRTTRIRTVDHRDVILPNQVVIENKITNHSMNPKLRLQVPVGIGYGEDIRKARQVLLACLEGHDLLETDPAPAVVVKELADSAVNLEIRAWLSNPAKERSALFDVMERAKIALDEAGIEIPFPQRTLHIAPESDPLSLRGPGSEGDSEEASVS